MVQGKCKVKGASKMRIFRVEGGPEIEVLMVYVLLRVHLK